MKFVTLEDGSIVNIDMIVLIGPDVKRVRHDGATASTYEIMLLNYPNNYRLYVTATDLENLKKSMEHNGGLL